jgi:uncharacterized protein (TIGR01777 family)
MDTVMITGGTGMIGRAVSKALLEAGFRVIILTRDHRVNDPVKTIQQQDEPAIVPALQYAGWNIEKGEIDREALAQADAIIHLAGAGIAEKRWTRKRKKEILDSRIKSGELLVNALSNYENKVRVVVSASAIGWYGPDPVIPNPNPFTEEMPAFNDFMGQTCKKWEASLDPVLSLGKRLVKLRTGFVLAKDGGAIREFDRPLMFGLATILGSGRQVISWIHIDDLVRLYIAAVKDAVFSGSYNAVGPTPVSNKELILQLGRRRRGRFFIPFYVPSFILKMVYGELMTEVLKSVTVSNRKVKDAGFIFQYPSITTALENC